MGIDPVSLGLIASAVVGVAGAGASVVAANKSAPKPGAVVATPGTKTSGTADASLQTAADNKRRAASSLLSNASSGGLGDTTQTTSALASGAAQTLGS